MPLRRGTVDKGLSRRHTRIFEDVQPTTLRCCRDKSHDGSTFHPLQTSRTWRSWRLGGYPIRRSQFTNSLGSVMYPVSAEAAAVAGLAR